MKYVTFCSFALLIGQIALAQSLPVPRVGSCPTGTSTQGGACVPRGNTQVFISSGPCPAGWTRSARHYCVR